MARVGARRVKDRDGEPALVAALADRESYVREMAVLGLSSLGDRRAVDALAAPRARSEMGVRGVLTDALGKLGGTHAVAALADLVLHDPDDHVRGMAAWSLRMTGGADAVRRSWRCCTIPARSGAAPRRATSPSFAMGAASIRWSR